MLVNNLLKITQQIFWGFHNSNTETQRRKQGGAPTDVEQPPTDNIRETGAGEELWRHVGAKAVLVSDVNIISSKCTCRAVVSCRCRRRTHSPGRPVSAHSSQGVSTLVVSHALLNFSWYNHISNNTCLKHFRHVRFLPRGMECRRGLAMRILSVCPSVRPSVKRVIRDKTEERSVQIFIPYER